MSNKNKIFIASISVLVLVALIGGFFYFKKNNKLEISQENSVPVDQLIKENEQAIENASNGQSQIVKSIDATDHVAGNTSAPVQLIIFNDFECGFCLKFQETIKSVKEVFGDKVLIGFRHFPLRSNPNAYYAALASECAAEQGKFWEMHDRLFINNEKSQMNIEQYKIDASELGLDIEKFDSCYNEERGKAKIEADLEEANKTGVAGSPQSFVNGKSLPGAYPFEDFTDSAGIERKGMKSLIGQALANN